MQHILDVQLPEENPQGAPGGDFQRIDTNANMFGGYGAKAEEQLGSGIEKTGETGLGIATAQTELHNKSAATDIKSWYADQTTDLHAKFMGLGGRAALDALPQYKQQLGQLKQQALDQASGLQTKALLGESLTTMQDQYYRYWSGHAGGQMKTYQDKVSGDAIASTSALAVNSLLAGDEQGFATRLREQDAEVHNLYDGQGYDADGMNSEVAKRRGTTLKVAIETVAAGGDVTKAQAIFDRYRSQMDPGSVLAVTANLKSGLAQVQGRDIADSESGHATPNAASVAGVPASFVAQVKRTEGYAPTAAWDVKQFSNGYGTKARFEGEQISKDEADARFQVEFSKAAKIVDSVNPNLDPGTRAALTSLTYNAGGDWTGAGLGDAIRAGDLDKAKRLFLSYNKAGGETNEGLASRRYREANWFGSGEAPAGNGPLVPRDQAYERVLARTDSNPLLQTAAIGRLNQVYGIYHAEQATQNATFDDRLSNTQAEAMSTGSVAKPLGEPEFVNRYGVEQGLKNYSEYQKNMATGADMAGLANMGLDDQAQVLSRRQPQAGSETFEADQERYDNVAKSIQHVVKERDADPAAFAIRRLPAVQSAYTNFNKTMADPQATPEVRRQASAVFAHQMLAEQQRVGVAPEDVKLLTAGQVHNVTGAIGAAAVSDDPKARIGVVARVKQLADQWGDYWPLVASQMAPTTQPIVKAIAAGADENAMTRLLSVDPKENPAKILKEQNEMTARNMGTALNTAMAPFLSSMVGRQKDRDYSGYHDLGEKLAALYVRDGDDASTAATKAFNALIGDRYTFADTYRIPKSPTIPADDVQRGAQEARNDILRGGNNPESPFNKIQLQVNDIGVSDNEADSRRNYARDGAFVTSPRNDGLNIAYHNTFVSSADGKPILLTWAQLARMGGKKTVRAADVFTRRADEVLQ